MELLLVEGPAAAPVSLDEAKVHLSVDHDDEDPLIEFYIAAAVEHLDGPTGILGRAIEEQTWALHLDAFPPAGIQIPLAPLIDVESITYVDSVGAEQTLAEDAYVVFDGPRGAVEPEYGLSWPSARCQRRAVTITFNAGYLAVPATIKAAILLMVGDLYENRESQLPGSISILPNSTVELLLAPLRARHSR